MGFAVGRASSKHRVLHLVQDFATFAGGQARPFHVSNAVSWRLSERSASSDFHSRFAQRSEVRVERCVEYGPRGRGLGTRFSFRLSTQKLAPRPGGNRGRHLRTPPHAAGRVGGGRAQACGGTPAAASVGYAHAPGGEATMAGRGAWRLDGGARRVETIAPSSPPPVVLGRRPTSPCNAPTLPFATVPVGAALETPAASNLRAQTRPMARAPVGNAKTHSTPSHYDGVEHKWWLPSPPLAAAAASVGVKPQAEAPHLAPVAPRNALRRRLRRRTCTARARAPRHRSVLRARAGPIESPSAAPP